MVMNFIAIAADICFQTLFIYQFGWGTKFVTGIFQSKLLIDFINFVN
jgi:hypothetical protein